MFGGGNHFGLSTDKEVLRHSCIPGRDDFIPLCDVTGDTKNDSYI